jgi:restriction system protein
MKVCSSCGAECDNSFEKCPECSSDFLSWKCSNCSEIYDAAFCPNCGVEAGNDGKLCPKCDKKYFGKSCPGCGYREGMENANKVYKPTVTADSSGGEGENKKIDLSGKGYSAQELLLADMAMNKKSSAPSPFDLAYLMPKKSKCKKSTALILCLFFGWIGAHQYYVGNSKKGMLYAMTMGLFFVGVLMDAVAIIQGDFKDKEGLPLS